VKVRESHTYAWFKGHAKKSSSARRLIRGARVLRRQIDERIGPRTRNPGRPPFVQKNFHPDRDLHQRYVVEDLAGIVDEFESSGSAPTFSVLLAVYKTPIAVLQETLNSLTNQVWQKWEVCIVDDASDDPAVRRCLERFSDQFPDKVKLAFNDTNQQIAGTLNRCIGLASGNYMVILDHDDLFLPNTLAEVARAVLKEGSPPILYSDERVVNADGSFEHDAFFKPAWSPEFVLSVNYVNHLCVYRADIIQKVGGYRLGCDAAEDVDLLLRAVAVSERDPIHIPMVLYHWRAIETSLASNASAKPYADAAGLRVIEDACARNGRPATVTRDQRTGHVRVRYLLHAKQPTVSLLVRLTKGGEGSHGNDLRWISNLCEASLIEHELIVALEAGRADRDGQREWEELVRAHLPHATVTTTNSGVPGRALSAGLALSKTDIVALVNHPCRSNTEGWLDTLVRVAQHSDIGVVGPMLTRPDGSIHSAGLLALGRHGRGFQHFGAPVNSTTYLHAINTTRNVVAVPFVGAVVRRSVLDRAGGMGDGVSFGSLIDLDLGLRLRNVGCRNVYEPQAELRFLDHDDRHVEHHQRTLLIRAHGASALEDPYLNPNLLPQDLVGVVDRQRDFVDFTTESREWVMKC
jgi:O-antigen biosynthesis protein